MSFTAAVNSPAKTPVPASASHAETPPIPMGHQANKRSQNDFENAKAHSKRVAFMQRALPISACLIVVAFIGSVLLSYTPSISDLSAEIGLENGKLVMKEPKMAGFDKNKRAYDVNAHKAIQDLAKPGTVELEKIDAKLPLGANAFAEIDADSGTYDSKNEKLNLRDNITITGASGMNIKLKEADIDIKTGNMVSDKPVFVQSNDADISANSIEVKDNGKRIVFKERVKMTIRRKLNDKPSATPEN